MFSLALILISLALIIAFLAVTDYEAQKGRRFFARERERLDQGVERVLSVVTHVDFGALIREEVRRLLGRVSHDIAHISLQLVRATERLLTRLVRSLRSRYASHSTLDRSSAREFVKTLSDFKAKLKETRPDVTEVQ